MQNVQPLRLSMNTVCSMLDVSREGLRKIMQNDPSFPRGIKSNQSRQAHVYFDYLDLLEWHKNQKHKSYST